MPVLQRLVLLDVDYKYIQTMECTRQPVIGHDVDKGKQGVKRKERAHHDYAVTPFGILQDLYERPLGWFLLSWCRLRKGAKDLDEGVHEVLCLYVSSDRSELFGGQTGQSRICLADCYDCRLALQQVF